MSDFEEIKRPAGGGWNADVDKNLLPPDDYRYAFNITRYGEENYGVVTNMKGNEKVSISLPLGTNKVIGQCYNLEDREIYYFLYNSNDDHAILRYNYDTDDIDYILKNESILNFNTSYPVNNPFTIGSGDEKMLFWTDNYNAPRKINVSRAYSFTNPTTTTTTTTT